MSALGRLLTLAAAARLVPHRPHPSALWRWGRRGLRARNGTTVRLGLVRYGGRLYTTAEALEAFGRELARNDLDDNDAAGNAGGAR